MRISRLLPATGYRYCLLELLSAFCLFLLWSCSTASEKDNQSTSPKFRQYYNQGEELYQKHCSNCHQKDGSGLGRIYPPVNKSDYMENNFNEVVCLMRNGKKGEVIVNGITFNQAMPGIPSLTDLEIAEIVTYIYNTWDHEKGLIEVKDVSTVLNQCAPVE
jgi:cytochrome c551